MSDDNSFTTEPGELVIGTSEQRILVRIKPDGTIVYGPDYTPDEAAKILWEALARTRKEDEDRRIYLAHADHLLKKLGAQDLQNERCQIKASGPNATPDDRFQAERSLQQLELYVHQLIELARGIALRDQEPPPPPPRDPSLN